MDIQVLAILLLIGRIISMAFIFMVLHRQWQIRKAKTHPRLIAMRRVLALLALLVFAGNIYPLILDILAIVMPSIRSTQVINLAGVLYSVDNNLTFMFASILIWTLYRLADAVIEVSELIKISDSTTKRRK